MATGGFKSNATTDFLEEWKAKREKMRAKMLGDIAAATGANSGRHAAPAAGTELTSSPERSTSTGNCHSVSRSSSGSALKRPEEEAHLPAHHPAASPGGTGLKKGPEKAQSPERGAAAGNDSDKESPSPGKESPSPGKESPSPGKESPSPGKAKEKSSSGPSARKGKGQIEKRKLREKRRSTGVVSLPSNESLDELDDDDAGEKERKEEEELVQANTFQNEAMTADPTTGHILDTPRAGSGRHKSAEEDGVGRGRQRHNRHGREGGAGTGSLERRIEELERELSRERQESARLLKAHQDKDDLIGKLKEEIDLLNRDLDDIEDENEQLKQENKTLLKVVGQLTR